MTVTCLPSTSSSTTNSTSSSSSTSSTRMGRRKQHCPQKTGLNSDNNGSVESATPGSINLRSTSKDEDNEVIESTHDNNNEDKADSASVSEHSEKEVTMPTLEALEPENRTPTEGTNGIQDALSKSGMSEEALSGMLKNPLFNPALLSLNPSLYAVQLAQLQAALSQSAGFQQLAAAAAASSSSLQRPKEQEELLNWRKRKLEEEESVLNLSKKSPVSSPKLRAESPLDLSGSRNLLSSSSSPAKAPKLDDSKFALPAWASSFPFLSPFLTPDAMNMSRFPAMASAASRLPPTSSPPASSTSSSASTSSLDRNPLERMSEIAKIGSRVGGGPRHSAWQSQWINRGPEANKDIFRCVWCKDSFGSLQALTTHMKETKHFGSSIPPSPQMQMPVRSPQPSNSLVKPPQTTPPSTSSASSSKTSRDILKEQLPMPRKLVRGQDVWLGKGEQQTKDILKCMWCGESFRSLDLMTRHMQETKHYTKVISQEQLVSWKSTDSQSSPQNHVNAVLTCKVCEQAFATLKDLTEHMVKNNHYKDNKTPGAPAGGPPVIPPSPVSANLRSVPSPGAQNKEKRKKSLPVRKLLELERAQQELTGQFKPHDQESPGKISCEKCGDKILMQHFVDHIRQCVGPITLPRPSQQETSRMRTPSVSPPRNSVSTTQSNSAEKEEPKSILGSLEKMVQNNFGAKKKPGPETNLSILQRLGIDEGVDYSKPLVDPMAMFRSPPMSMASNSAMAAAFGAFFNRSGRDTRSNSECSSPDRFKQERPASNKSESSVKSTRSSSDIAVKKEEEEEEEKKKIKKEEPMNVDGEDDEIEEKIKVDDDDEDEEEATNEEKSKAESISRPSSNGSSIQQRQTPSKEKIESKSEAEEEDEEEKERERKNEKEKEEGKRKKKSNPLAALQMLCDKTEKTPKTSNSSSSTSTSVYGGPTDPGAILAFSWACNQAVVNDSLLKCPFCETPFISKGAYRHHLSKMHFVKDGLNPETRMMARTPEKSPTPSNSNESKEENTQSKFAKYSQMAKQLSCSGQP